MKKIFLPFTLLILTLGACDPALDWSKLVKNDSDHDVWIAFGPLDNPNHLNHDTIYINKNSEVLIKSGGGIGSVGYYPGVCSIVSDTFYSKVITADSLKLDIDFANDDNWAYVETTKYSNGGGVYECTLIITNEHVK